MRTENFTILCIDDDLNDQALITRAFRKNGVVCPIKCVRSGEEAIQYLNGDGKFADRGEYPYPSFIMTDLKMSPGDGFHVLQHLKSTPEWAVIPTVVFSSSQDRDDIKRSYMLGAGSYIVKPGNYEDLRKALGTFYAYWVLCETPETDLSGKRIPTNSKGKLGERFINQNNNEEV